MRWSLPHLRAAEGAIAVTNDHFDEDGLIALYGLVAPEAALSASSLLTGIASCGDFGIVASDTAAQICFAIGPLAEKEAGPTSATSEQYQAVLPRLPELLEHPERFEPLWSEEWASLEAETTALESGAVVVDEYRHLDLAVVRRLQPSPALAQLVGGAGASPREPVAVHSATSASRILAFDGDRCELHLRYESWVRLVSRRVPLRPDLAPLAVELSEKEPSGTQWEENGVGAIVTRLRPAGGLTEIDPAVIVATVCEYLTSAPPAWDPFREGAAYIPPRERSSTSHHAPDRAALHARPGGRGPAGEPDRAAHRTTQWTGRPHSGIHRSFCGSSLRSSFNTSARRSSLGTSRFSLPGSGRKG